MATYQLFNDTESVKLIEAGVTHTLDKSYSLYVLGECVHIYYQRKDAPAWVINYNDVTVPTVASAEALRSQLESWKTISLGTVSIDTTGLATSANQTDGSQKTKITDGAGVVNTKQLGTSITSSDVGLITNSIIHGQTTGGGGGYVDVKVTPSGALTVEVNDGGGSITVDGTVTANTGLSQPLTDTQLRASAVPVSGTITSTFKSFMTDAASRMRVSLPTTWGEYKMLNNNFASLLLEQAGTATFTNNTNRVTMSVTSGKYGIIQTKQYHPYFNGKSQLIELTTAGANQLHAGG